jgi:hypothetical protein
MTTRQHVVREMPKRVAFVLASLSVALGIFGSMRAGAAFRSNQPGVLRWMVLPVILATRNGLAEPLAGNTARQVTQQEVCASWNDLPSQRFEILL